MRRGEEWKTACEASCGATEARTLDAPRWPVPRVVLGVVALPTMSARLAWAGVLTALIVLVGRAVASWRRRVVLGEDDQADWWYGDPIDAVPAAEPGLQADGWEDYEIDAL